MIFLSWYFEVTSNTYRFMGHIGVLGGGWLGEDFAKKATLSGLQVRMTTTDMKKLRRLGDQRHKACFLKVTESAIEGQLDFFSELDVLVITVPPGLRKNPNANYESVIGQIIKKIEAFGIKKVIFTSSTSVYGYQEGIITENSQLLGETLSAKQIISVEEKLLSNQNFESIIVRLGGLMGPNRHPIYNLSKKKNLPDPNSPINFIHRQDAVVILLQLIQNWKGNEVYNAVTPFHPSRKEYYSQMAKMANLPPPTFENKGKIRGIISSEKLVLELNGQFKVKNLLILN